MGKYRTSQGRIVVTTDAGESAREAKADEGGAYDNLTAKELITAVKAGTLNQTQKIIAHLIRRLAHAEDEITRLKRGAS